MVGSQFKWRQTVARAVIVVQVKFPITKQEDLINVRLPKRQPVAFTKSFAEHPKSRLVQVEQRLATAGGHLFSSYT